MGRLKFLLLAAFAVLLAAPGAVAEARMLMPGVSNRFSPRISTVPTMGARTAR